MKVLSSIKDIPHFTSQNIKIRNEEELLEKINKLITGGAQKLQIVTDFDYTLTRHNLDDGTSVLTSFGMFGQCPSVPVHYKDEDKRLSSIYKPIEADPVMSAEEKTKHMVEWYLAANKLLTGIKFPWIELREVAQKMIESFRIGVRDMIAWSEVAQVPVLVFSAGLGECVTAALEAANFLLPHVKVVSNFLAMDDNCTIVGMKGEVIHTYNKNETVIKNTEYYDMVRNRSNVILMGDNIGDAGMAEGMEHCDVVIKIGFLGKNLQNNLQNYLNIFDIVLVDDPTMNVLNAMLKLLQCHCM